MDDSDDYGYDDFVLDEQTLAALDQAERNYQNSLPKPLVHSEPVNKRHKTETGWKAGYGSANYPDDDNFDNLPEISVRGDGSYSIRTTTANQKADPRPKVKETHKVSTVPSVGPSSSSTNFPPPDPKPPIRPTIHSKASLPSQQAANKSNDYVASNKSEQPSQIEKRLKELQKDLEQLREENSKVQSALKNAVEAKMIKEGEVSILRKNIESSSQIHAAQIAQLKAEKEQADAKRLQLQIEMEKQLEALRTDYKFKEQELAASVRKPPASVRGKKAQRDFPATPLPPRVGRSYAQDISEASASRKIPDETPRTFRPLPPLFKVSPVKNGRKSPEKKKVSLPGFENAFESCTPMRSPSKRENRKGKLKSMFDADSNENPFSASVPPAPETFAQAMQVEQDTMIQDVSSHNFDTVMDEEMDVVTQEADENSPVAEQLDWVNWKAELCRIILTHSHASADQITFQQLLGSLNAVEDGKTYSASCARILNVLSTSLRSDDYEPSFLVVCVNLQSILCSLYHAKQLVPLSALFDLLTELILSIPTFLKLLLSSRPSPKEEPSMVSILQNVVLEQLGPDKLPEHSELARSLQTLLESICFHPSPSSTEQLQVFSQNRDVLVHLVQSSHPKWFLERSFRLLALLSTHHDIWGTLLGANPHDGSKNLLIDRLCSHLVDTSKSATEKYKSYILVFFSQLSVAHPGARATLVESQTLIPSLIFFTSHLTNPLWEDDDQLVSSKEALSMLVQTISQTMCLLYRLVFATDPCVNLRSRIQQAPIRPFSILLPTFTVSFGRLSYAEPPSWVDAENRQELESIAEIVRDLLELVIDGPEGDSVWATFQPEQDEDSTADVDDLEARLMGNEA